MSSPEGAFEKLVGRQATDKERQQLYRVRDALGIKITDSLWTVIFVLEFYKGLYEDIPRKIAEAASAAVAAAKTTAEAQAKAAAEETKRALTSGVLKIVGHTAKRATLKEILMWAGVTVLSLSVLLVTVGWWAFHRGDTEGQNRAARAAEQDREHRAAESSWARTEDGRLAYELARAGMLHEMMSCSGRGLVMRDGWCIAQGERGRPFRWRLPQGSGSP
jgi:hypothetical protein